MEECIRSGALAALMAAHPPLPAGAFIVRAAGRNPASRACMLADFLLDALPDMAEVLVRGHAT